jgi:tRNA (cytidine/uridine-2'-O-)-methyltransferase
MSTPKLNVVLVHPEIPHNTGAIGRLCVGVDATLHLIRPLGFAITDRNVQRAGLDYWEHLDLIIHDDWNAFLKQQQPEQLYFASTKGQPSVYECEFRPNSYLVFGSESSGLPEEMYHRYAADLYCIPMPGQHARSLNLANAVAVVLYEAYRQLACQVEQHGRVKTPRARAHHNAFQRSEPHARIDR